jgi:hypothetical protein
MLTYERIVQLLERAALNTDMDLYRAQHKIVMPEMDREFVAQCVPEEYKPPYFTRSEISFHWDSMMTSESVYGGNCALFHDETEECTHDDLENQSFIELEIKYHFDLIKDYERSTDLINAELIQLFEKYMQHENQPVLNWELVINKSMGMNLISNLSASHHWIFELDTEVLQFESIFMEIKEVLIEINKLPFIKKFLG